MKWSIVERLDDSYINFFEEWIFIKCFEYSAIVLNEIFWYKLTTNIDKKTGIVFLELWFPKIKKEEILFQIVWKWYSYRLFSKDSKLISSEQFSIELNKDLDKIIQIKKQLVKFD